MPDQETTSQDTLREVIDVIDHGVALFDAEGCLVLVNAHFCNTHATLLDVLRPGLPWNIFLREAVNRAAFSKPVSNRLDLIESGLTGEADANDPVLMPSAHGQVFAYMIHQTSDGGFALTQTVTHAETTEVDAAREAEALLRKVLEACPASLTMSRINDGLILYRSPAATALLGTARSSFAHFAHRKQRADFVTALLPDGMVDNMRATCLRADGQEFPADVSARLIDYRGEDVIVANIEDLTDELSVQAELDRQKEQLFQLEKMSALGELLAGIAHELNNPLSIIVGNADILQEELEGTVLSRRLDKLSTAAHRCVRIVRSFLSLAREEPLDLAPVAPRKLIEIAKEATSAELDKGGIGLHVTCPDDCPPVTADEVQMSQVIINLVINAAHAIRDAGFGDRIELECQPLDGFLRITVSDNGPGIPEMIKNRVFDPLFTTKETGKGTGVGLAFCLRTVNAHQGQIRLEANSQPGATFVVDLPISAE